MYQGDSSSVASSASTPGRISGIVVLALLAVVGVSRIAAQRVHGPNGPGLATPLPQSKQLAKDPPAPSQSGGLDAGRIRLLAPYWHRDLAEHGEYKVRQILPGRLDEALVVRDGDTLLRLRLSNGSITARYLLPPKSPDHDLGTIVADRAILGLAAPTVRALDGKTLAPVWDHTIESFYMNPPVAVGNDRVLAVASIKNWAAPYALHLLDASTGRLLWSRVIAGETHYCVFHADALRIYLACQSTNSATPAWLSALDAKDGTELWRNSIENPFISFMNSNGTWLAWGHSYSAGCLTVDAATGARMRRVSLAQGSRCKRGIFDGEDLLVLEESAGGVDCALVALDMTTGQPRWRQPAPSQCFAQLSVAGVIYLADSDGELVVRERERGELLWKWSLGDTIANVSLPDASGARPLVALVDNELAAFIPGSFPVPIEHATITGHVYQMPPSSRPQEVTLGRETVPIDAKGNYRAVVEGRGTLRLAAGTCVKRHGVRPRYDRRYCDGVLRVPLTGKGRYRIDVDAMQDND